MARPSDLMPTLRANAARALVLAVIAAVGKPTPIFAQEQPAPAQATPDAVARPARQPVEQPDPDQESDPAKKLILEAARAVRALKSLSYRSKYYSTGAFEMMAPRGEAHIAMVRSAASDRVWLQHATGSGAKPGDANTDFDVVWLENSVEWLDHAQKKLISRPTRQAKGAAYQLADAMRMKELVEPVPFSKEVLAESFVHEGPGEVNGIPCQMVVVSQAGGRNKVRWWIADADKLPRKSVRLYGEAGGAMEPSEVVMELTDVQADAPIGEDSIAVIAPPGYARDEVAAPKGLSAPNLNRSPRPESTPGAPGNAADPSNEPPPAPPKPKAPPFELNSANNEKVSLASLSGNIVILQFWGTWHLPSRAACAELSTLADHLKDQKVKVYALSVREKDDDTPKEFVRGNGYAFGVLLRADKVAETYGVSVFPTYVIIGPEGELIDTITGYKKDETMKKLAEALSKAAGTPRPDGRASR